MGTFQNVPTQRKLRPIITEILQPQQPSAGQDGKKGGCEGGILVTMRGLEDVWDIGVEDCVMELRVKEFDAGTGDFNGI